MTQIIEVTLNTNRYVVEIFQSYAIVYVIKTTRSGFNYRSRIKPGSQNHKRVLRALEKE